MKTTKQVSAGVVLKSVQKEAQPLIKKMEKITKIDSQELYEDAGKYIKQLKTLGKLADEKRKTIVNPLNQAIKATNELFKPFEDQLTKLEKETKRMMIAWDDKLEEARNKLLKKHETGKIGVIALTNNIAKLSSSSAYSKTTTQKVIEIVDVSLIPREYLIPDMVLIKQALKDGIEIPGVVESTKKNIAI